MYSSDEEYFRLLVEKPSVFKKPNYLSINYIPPYLPHREEELHTLAKYFKDITTEKGGASRKVIITGAIGSGKTTLAKRFGQVLSNVVNKRKFRFVYINCRIYKSPYVIFNTIAKQLKRSIPPRGYSFEELQFLLVDLLNTLKVKLLVVLDEVDYLISKYGTDVLYDLLRLGELTDIQYMSYIFIAKNTNFLNLLDKSTKSSFQLNHLRLSRYSESDLCDIIKARADIALYEGSITNDAIELIADIAGKSGDARYAIELLWGSGQCCDNENSPVIYPNHVRKAKSLIHPELRKEFLMSLSLHLKLVLLAIVRKLKYTNNAYVSTNEVINNYQLICEEYKEEPRKHTQFWTYLQELTKLDIIYTKLSGKGMKGKTTLISIPDTPLEIIERVLTDSIMKEKQIKNGIRDDFKW